MEVIEIHHYYKYNINISRSFYLTMEIPRWVFLPLGFLPLSPEPSRIFQKKYNAIPQGSLR